MNKEAIQQKIKKQELFVVDSFDLDDIIAAVFPEAKWEHGDFNCSKEAGNDTSIEVTVNPDHDGDWEAGELAKNLAGERCSGYGDPDLLMNEMCRRELIEPGTYIVHVCW